MFRPVNQRVPILFAIALINLSLFFWVSSSRSPMYSSGFEQKVESAELFNESIDIIREYQTLRENFVIDKEDDPFLSGLIGPPTTLITTSLANLRSKQTTINPNIAAMIVELFYESKLKSGDTVAVGMTGSFPALNIAFLTACKAMNITPIVISSVGSSRWGATDPYFTWLDMETLLYDEGIIKSKSIAASYGGVADRAKGLKSEGIDFLWEAIYRNEVKFLESNKLSIAIEKRLAEYNKILSINEYDAYINIGGGAASIGQSVNAKLIPNGVSSSNDIGDLIGNSVIKEFLINDVKIIHLYDTIELAMKYQLKVFPDKFYDLGNGPIYLEQRYNMIYTYIALFITLSILIGISVITNKQIKVRMSSHESESLL